METAEQRTRRRAAFALLALAALVVASCRARPVSQHPLTDVDVAPTTFPASAPIYVAAEKGFFRDEGLDANVHKYAAGRLALDAALAGKADFATVADTPIARAVLDSASPVVVGEVAEVDSANVIVARRDHGIAKAADLKGKRVGVVAGTSADFFLHIYLVSSGVDPTSVTRVPLMPDAQIAAVASGTVDAVSVFAPYTFEAQDALGANAVVLDEPGLYSTTWNIVVRPDLANGDRSTVVSFLRATMRAIDFIEANPGEAQAITSRNTGISLDRIRQLWPEQQWALKLDQTLILTLEDESRWMLGGKGTPPDFLKYIDVRPLQQVLPSAVGIEQPKD